MTPSAAPVKCVIWDLDDTLWRGTLIECDTLHPVRDRLALLQAMDRRGVLQSVASRGDHGLAEARLREYDLFDLLVWPQIGWRDKSEAIHDIVGALGFAPESFVFVDNDPYERAEVAAAHPAMRCMSPEEADRFLPDLIRTLPITAEGRARRGAYQSDLLRQDAERRATDKHDFERSLELKLTVRTATAGDLARCEELTRRTTQLNTTGLAVSEDEFAAMLDDDGYAVLVASLSDRFGDYGTIGLAILRSGQVSWDLLLLATSCRVVSRGVGGMLLHLLVAATASSGRPLLVDVVPTVRNRPMVLALRFAGFTPRHQAEGGRVQRFEAANGPPRSFPAHVALDLSLGPLLSPRV